MKNRSLLLLAGFFLFAIGCDKGGSQPNVDLPKAELSESDGKTSEIPKPAQEAGGDSLPKMPESGPMLPPPPDRQADPMPKTSAANSPADNPPADTSAADGSPAESPAEESPAEETDEESDIDPTVFVPEGPIAERNAREAFLPPPNATSLSKEGRLWIDAKRKRVYVDGYVALTHGPLEMFACPVGTKEHESIVAVLAKSSEVHAALLAVDGTPGTPVRFRPEFNPPTGQVIRVWVCWYDSTDQFHAVDARQWIQDLETEKTMSAEWVFAGSGFWQDPEDKREYYRADSGDMICVSNFSSAMLDVAISSSADADSLRFVPFESKIPDRSTSVRLVLAPVPNPADSSESPQETDVLELPTARDLPQQK